MKNRFMGGLILALAFTAANGADPQSSSAPEMKLTLKNGHTLMIDADKLGPAHASTVAFVFQFDPHSSKTAKEISDALAALVVASLSTMLRRLSTATFKLTAPILERTAPQVRSTKWTPPPIRQLLLSVLVLLRPA